MSSRQTIEIAVKISHEERLILENALENYPDAVEIRLYPQVPEGYRGFAQWMINDPTVWVPDWPMPEPTLLSDLEWYPHVKINYARCNLHMESAPDEWTFISSEFRYYLHATFHTPLFTST